MRQRLLVKPDRDATGGRSSTSPRQSAGWTLCRLRRLPPRAGRDGAAATTGEREVCLVFVSGKARVSAGGSDFGDSASARRPSTGKPWAVYVPPASTGGDGATTDVRARRLLGAGDRRAHRRASSARTTSAHETRGKGTNTRYVTNILPETEPTAESLLVVEVITPGGHWSTYPPHKHDRDELPREIAARGDLLPPPEPAAGLRHPARLHRRPLARRDDGGRGRRRDAGAARLPPVRRAARLRPLLSQRHGRAEAHLAVPQRPGARVDAEAAGLSAGNELKEQMATC